MPLLSNEVLFILSALIDIGVICIAARLGKKWVFATIAMNLILVDIFGAKLIPLFGFVTNAGNVFYACVFFATHILFERFGKSAALTSIWFGAGFVLFFIAMSQLTLQIAGSPLSASMNSALATLFMFAPRVVIASIIGYIFAQSINISLYGWIKDHTNGRLLWLRSNGANIVSQLVDSSLFFSIAFFDLPGPVLVQTILVGWVAKSAVVALGTPFLYSDTYLFRKK